MAGPVTSITGSREPLAAKGALGDFISIGEIKHRSPLYEIAHPQRSFPDENMYQLGIVEVRPTFECILEMNPA